jgi:endonuclease YncB( thermonuclease family)
MSIDPYICTVSFSTCLSFADFSGSVVSVLDGDTIEVLHNNHAERIRLSGIDCPNYSQVTPRNRVVFNSAEEAGYRVAGNCP